MKTTLKLLMVVLMTGWCNLGEAQIYEWQKPVQSNEQYIGYVSCEVSAGYIRYIKDGSSATFMNGQRTSDSRTTKAEGELYRELYNTARSQYGSVYPNFSIRTFSSSMHERKANLDDDANQWGYDRYYLVQGQVVIPRPPVIVNNNDSRVEDDEESDLSKALDKALQDIREGSRIAIDQVKVPSGENKEEYKDEVVEILLDKGYKVVAKEYLEKLYEEQQAQQSGIYNDRTTVKGDNFSAVGYYLNVSLTETSLRVQIINVSTGEYDANVTIKF